MPVLVDRAVARRLAPFIYIVGWIGEPTVDGRVRHLVCLGRTEHHALAHGSPRNAALHVAPVATIRPSFRRRPLHPAKAPVHRNLDEVEVVVHGTIRFGEFIARPVERLSPIRVVHDIHDRAEHRLLHVVGADDPLGGIPGFVERGQQQGRQDGDDGDHHQQLDEREVRGFSVGHGSGPPEYG